MAIYVIRHGQTNWNISGLYQGHTDIPLNETGIMQANILKKKLKDIHFDAVFSSPLSRAYDTAKICLSNRNINITIDDNLIERYFGDLEGHNSSEFTDCTNDLLLNYSMNYSDYNVEPIHDLFKRVYSFLDNIIQTYKNKNVLLVTHSAITIAIDCYFNGISQNTKLINLSLNNGEYREYEEVKPMKKFSIIIPTYNVEDYIETCIESVLSQTFKDYELIVIDDCSTTHGKAFEKIKNNPNIIFDKTPKNLRAGGARNLGIQKATGEYILFLDSDDKLHNTQTLEKINNTIGTDTPDIIYTGFQFIGGENLTFIPTTENCTKEFRLSKNKFINVWSIIWNRNFITKNNLHFEENMYYEDLPFAFEGIALSDYYKIADYITYDYTRERPGSSTQKKGNSSKNFAQSIDTIKAIQLLYNMRNRIPSNCLPYLQKRIDEQKNRLVVRMERAMEEDPVIKSNQAER